MKIGWLIIPKVSHFKYLGGLDLDLSYKVTEIKMVLSIGSTQGEWRIALSIICNRKVLHKLEGKFYHSYKTCNVVWD